MRVVVDNNVFVSAAITPLGPPGAVVRAWRESRIELIVSLPLLAELTIVLARPRIRARTGWTITDEREFIANLAEGGIEVHPREAVSVSRDPSDNRVLEAAYAGAADYIVSGDDDLLVLMYFAGIPIVSPARFLALLNKGA